jgi:Family of unknown function (DUF6879)
MSLANVTQDVKLIPMAEDKLSDAFSGFRQSAFRLELLQAYEVEAEKSDYADFLSGKIPTSCPACLVEWCQEIEAASTEGRTFQRVRLIDFPITDYTRFEVIFGYRFTVQHGEDIRIIQRQDFESLVAPLSKDFWLFDDNLCVILDYDINGSYRGCWQTENSFNSHFVDYKATLLQRSVKLKNSHAWQMIGRDLES